MRLLLDTHALVWWWRNDARLPEAARLAIADRKNVVLVSAVTALEVATKVRIGKWPEALSFVDGFEAKVAQSKFKAMPVDLRHAQMAGSLPGTHRDPFDRLLAAQCLIEAATLVSPDEVLAQFGLTVLWAGTKH